MNEKNVSIIKGKNCCGCGVCVTVCPREGVNLYLDENGYYKCRIDEEKCIHCGKCLDICPNNCKPLPIPVKSFVGCCKSEPDAWKSTSGGAGYMIAKTYLDKGYVVIGAVWNADYGAVEHAVVKSVEGLDRLRKSKYIQSYTPNAFRVIKDFDKVVVFGTPCQIAGLRQLYGNREGLILVDFDCMGPAGKNLWNKALQYYNSVDDSGIENVQMRDKKKSWMMYGMRIGFKSGHMYWKDKFHDPFCILFNSARIVQETCINNCQYRNASMADIRIGDGWYYTDGFTRQQIRNGLSIVTPITKNGEEIKNMISKNMDFHEVERIFQEKPLSSSNKKIVECINNPDKNIWDAVNLYNEVSFLKRIIREVEKARYFAEDRVSLEIDNYHGEKEGTVLIDDHGPLWPVYLGDALTFAGVEARNSFIIRFAQIITAYLMLLMLANTAGAIMGWVSAGLSVVVALCYRYIMHFPLYGSRDGFRFIALFLYILVIYDLLYRVISIDDHDNMKQGYTWREYILLTVATYLCLNGHGGNTYFIFCLFCLLALTAFVCVRNRRFWTLFFLSISTGIGSALCLVKNVLLYISTGSFRSYTSFVYQGTVVEKILESQKETENTQNLKALLVNYTQEEKSILLFSLILLIIAVLYSTTAILILRSRNKSIHHDLLKLGICCLIVLSLFIPLTGALDFIAGDVQNWFLSQSRYRMFVYLTCGLLCGVCCGYFITNYTGIRYLFFGIAVIPFWIASSTMKSYYPTLYTNYRSYEAVAFFEKTAAAADQLIKDGYTLSNDQVISWYLDKPAKLTICNYVVPLFRANSLLHLKLA